jgi:RES domain-containing protein
MRLWRLTRAGQAALDGAGAWKHGGRYSPPGAPVVNFASEAGLAVLVALRYLPGDPADAPDEP